MSQEPSINSIIEYLNYHGHLFLKVASDREFVEIEEIYPFQISKNL
jgi:hypothetical protein